MYVGLLTKYDQSLQHTHQFVHVFLHYTMVTYAYTCTRYLTVCVGRLRWLILFASLNIRGYVIICLSKLHVQLAATCTILRDLLYILFQT